MSRKLIKRFQRKALGGMVFGRIYDDGTVRIRTDHPSNDPAVEIAMAAVVIAVVREKGREAGIEYLPSGPLNWRDDPPRSPA